MQLRSKIVLVSVVAGHLLACALAGVASLLVDSPMVAPFGVFLWVLAVIEIALPVIGIVTMIVLRSVRWNPALLFSVAVGCCFLLGYFILCGATF